MDPRQISGAPYDWKITGKPESPYTFDYSQTITMKMFLASKIPGGGTKIVINLDDALEKIKAVDKITLGVKKIVYLVGWQYDGHDSKYPAWHECNPGLKREGDATARDSVIWLMNEAKKYNTSVSLHINMMDAYTNSPLWDEYLEKGYICKNSEGKPLKGGCWDGEQAYLTCYKNEWDSGAAIKRIDELLELLPPIKDAGTIHIDAFMNPCIRGGCCECNKGENYGMPALETKRKIIRYFRTYGIDVTSEYISIQPEEPAGDDYLIGLQPMAYHLTQSPEVYIERPATIICGGNAGNRYRGESSRLMRNVFGQNIVGEDLFPQENYKQRFLEEFCLTFLPFSFLNSKKRLSLEKYAEEGYRAYFSDDVMTDIDGFTIRQGNITLKKNSNIMLPAIWMGEDNLLIYSKEAGQHTWAVGAYLGDKIKIRRLTVDGMSANEEIITAVNGKITLDHTADSAFYCTKA